MARRCRAVASFLRQRAMGVRRTWPEAPPRSQHQRCCDRGKGPPLSLGRTGAAARGCCGVGGWSVLKILSVAPANAGPIRREFSFEARWATTSLNHARAFAGTTIDYAAALGRA